MYPTSSRWKRPVPAPQKAVPVVANPCCHCGGDLASNPEAMVRASCKIHFACSQKCQILGCKLCICDGCDEPVKEDKSQPLCQHLYHKKCLEELGGINPETGECLWCKTDESADQTGVAGFISKVTTWKTHSGDAFLSEGKLRRHGWDAALLKNKVYYTPKSILSMKMPLKKMLEKGFSPAYMAEKGMTTNEFVKHLFHLGVTESPDLVSEYLMATKPSLESLIADVATVVGIQRNGEDALAQVIQHLGRRFFLSKENLVSITSDSYQVDLLGPDLLKLLATKKEQKSLVV